MRRRDLLKLSGGLVAFPCLAKKKEKEDETNEVRMIHPDDLPRFELQVKEGSLWRLYLSFPFQSKIDLEIIRQDYDKIRIYDNREAEEFKIPRLNEIKVLSIFCKKAPCVF